MKIVPVTVYVEDKGDEYECFLEDVLVSRGIPVFTEDEYLKNIEEDEDLWKS